MMLPDGLWTLLGKRSDEMGRLAGCQIFDAMFAPKFLNDH
jgi:hypothetical protein